MAIKDFNEQRPLLDKITFQYSSIDSENATAAEHLHSRAVEDDVLPEPSSLGRNLSWHSAYILVISRVVGSGIFATPGVILRSVGSPGLSLLIWIVGALVAACGLAISLEYGCMLPRSGGQKVYLEFTYRHPRFLASTLVAINAVFLGFTASNCVVFSQYTLFALGAGHVGDSLRKGVAVGLLTAATLVHAITPKFGVRLQNLLGWTKIGIVIFMALAGCYVVMFRPLIQESTAHTSSLLSWDNAWEDSSWNWGVIATAIFKAVYSYSGLDNVSNVLNEVKDPIRTLRSVTLTALATSCAMYFLVNVAYFLVVPVEDIKESGELIAALFFERVFGGQIGTSILPLAVALSAAGNVFVVVFAMSRLKQEIARQGFLPFSAFLSSTKPFNSPMGGLLVNYIPSLLVIILPPSSEVYSFILETEGYSGQIFGLAVGFGLVWLRLKRPDIRRPFKAWMPAVALKLALSLALLAAPFFPPVIKFRHGLFYAAYAILAVGLILGSILYWYLWTVLIPRVKGYRLEEEAAMLDDGTWITQIVHKPL